VEGKTRLSLAKKTPAFQTPTPVVEAVPGAKAQLRVLLVEDSPDDAELTIAALVGGGYHPTVERVDTAAAMAAALERGTWDVVISDYTLPGFDAPGALATLQSRGVDLPFIIVSGTVGDDVAVAAMKAGAHDFIVKGKLARLVPALERELREAEIRREQRRMREQLLISERMASAGTLAAGVAHEINNPLAVVAANLEILTGTLARLVPAAQALAGSVGLGTEMASWTAWLQGRLAEAEEPLADAREGVIRIRDIVRDVKLFSSSRSEGHGPVDVRAVVESSLRMAWNEIRHRARLQKDYGDVPPVDANEGRLGQVLLNLLINAAQAIPEGDAANNRIRVTTRVLPPGRVAIEVMDTGAGIPREILDRIFEPFFTTKPIGVGTGLGLAICHRIVTDLGGELSVDSEVGKGSTFRIVLAATQRVSQSVVEPAARAGRRARILLIDDEVALGRALQRALSRHHDVTVSNNGRDALSRVLGGERYDVIVSDLMMPEMTGMEIHDELSRRAPEQAGRMVFLTGGAFSEGARLFLEAVPNPRIDKPVEMTGLLEIVAGLL
jgi:signal transduction histidine kinase